MGPLQRVARHMPDQLARVGHELDADHAREQAFVLGDEAHRLADVERRRRMSRPSTSPVAGVERDQPQQAADHGRLARAVGPEQADRPLRQRPPRGPQCRDLAVGLRDLAKIEEHETSQSRPARPSWGERMR